MDYRHLSTNDLLRKWNRLLGRTEPQYMRIKTAVASELKRRGVWDAN